MQLHSYSRVLAVAMFVFRKTSWIPITSKFKYCDVVPPLQEYAKLQVGVPQVHPGMEPVEPEQKHDCSEICHKVKYKVSTHVLGVYYWM